MFSDTCSCYGFVFDFVIVISPKCVDGWYWFVDNIEGSNGGGGGRGGCKNRGWNELNEGWGKGGGCRGNFCFLLICRGFLLSSFYLTGPDWLSLVFLWSSSGILRLNWTLSLSNSLNLSPIL